MKRVLLITMAVLALEVLAKDKIYGARKGSNRKLDAAEAGRIYGTLKDEEFLAELIEFRNGKDKVPKEDFDRLFNYGLDKELVERAGKSEPLQKELLAKIEDKKTPAEIRRSAVRHIWKIRRKPDQVESDEALLRRVHAANAQDPELRIETLKELSTSSDSNIALLENVALTTQNKDELGAAVNRLGKIGQKAEKEGRKSQESRIRNQLIGLRKAGRINLAQLSTARNFSDTKEGRRYLKEELAKDGFRDWQEVLYAVGPDAGYENVRRAHKKVKTEKTFERDQEALKLLAKSNIEGFKDAGGLKDSESKKDFLEMRALILDASDTPAADAAVADLLYDQDASVRMQAVLAAHFGLKDNYRLLSTLYAAEKDETIRNFLRGHGYAE